MKKRIRVKLEGGRKAKRIRIIRIASEPNLAIFFFFVRVDNMFLYEGGESMKRLGFIYKMDQVCGVNKKSFKVGKTLTIAGLVTTVVGSVLSFATVGKFTPGDYDKAQEFVDSVLG